MLNREIKQKNIFISAATREGEGDSRGYRTAEEQARELARSIRREVTKLADKWNALVDRSDAWARCLDDAAQVSLLFEFFRRLWKNIDIIFVLKVLNVF